MILSIHSRHVRTQSEAMRTSLVTIIAILAVVCIATVSAQSPGPNAVHVTLLHLNDCYELLPTAGTDVGGVARVATLRKQLLAKNPNTFTLLAGDLFAPSALSSTPVPNPSGKTYDGNQMVLAMNAIGVDAACMGNHETDLKIAPFTVNMNLSNFTWLSANAQIFGYHNLQKTMILETKPVAPATNTVKLGLLGMTIDSNNRTGVETYFGFEYASTIIAPAEIANLNSQGADIIVALTHYDYAVDQQLVERNSGISIVVGGHDHNVVELKTPGKASVYKADSNVRTVWVHDIWVDKSVDRTDPNYFIHKPTLITINATFENDNYTMSVIQPYIDGAYASFAVSGFNATQVVCTLTEALDMRQAIMSSGDINNPILAAKMFTEAIYQSGVEQTRKNLPNHIPIIPDMALFNVGSLRLDDVVAAGTTLQQYDILRITPFLNRVELANVTGQLLLQLFTTALRQSNGVAKATISQYLTYTNVTTVINPDLTRDWLIAGVKVDPLKWYVVSATNFMLGGPAPYPFFSQAASPNDFKYVYRTIATDLESDPRIYFIQLLTAQFPVGGHPGPGPNPVGEKSYVYFSIQYPSSSIDQAFVTAVATEISTGLQIRLDRITIIQAATSATDDYATTIFFSIAPNVAPDPITAEQAASMFVTQVESGTSTLRTGKYIKMYVAGSAHISPDSTPPPIGDSDGMAAANQTAGSMLAVIILAFVAMRAQMM